MSLSIKCLLLGICLWSCVPTSNKSADELLATYLDSYDHSLDTLNAILVLTELGCPNCNRSFALFLEKHLSHPRTLCIISAHGSIVDISPFVSNRQLIFDFENDFYLTGLSAESCVIFIEESKIDTIVKIQAEGINTTFDFLAQRLENTVD